jgi:hypothetical protein
LAKLYEFPLIETAKEEEFDFVAEQIKTVTFLQQLLSVIMQ